MPRSGSSTQDLAHPVALDRHAGQADDVERLERVEVDLLDVLIDEDDLVLGRRQPGQHRQCQHGHVGPLAQQGQAVIEAPERDREARVDQADPCHGRGLSTREEISKTQAIRAFGMRLVAGVS